MCRISMTREILKEEGCSAYGLSPNRLKQDVLIDGRYSKNMGEYQ